MDVPSSLTHAGKHSTAPGHHFTGLGLQMELADTIAASAVTSCSRWNIEAAGKDKILSLVPPPLSWQNDFSSRPQNPRRLCPAGTGAMINALPPTQLPDCAGSMVGCQKMSLSSSETISEVPSWCSHTSIFLDGISSCDFTGGVFLSLKENPDIF